MGKKVIPTGFRVGVYEPWCSRWFARDSYASYLHEDLAIRDYIKKNLSNAEIDKVEVERTGDNIRVIIHSARPGVVIGKKGQEIESLKERLAKHINKSTVDVSVQELKQPEISSQVIADSITEQIERRVNYKKAMKKAAASAMRSDIRGIKIRVAGRLGGAEIARIEWIRIGAAPLHTLRSEIDFASSEAQTMYGVIGVKVWICKGEYKVAD